MAVQLAAMPLSGIADPDATSAATAAFMEVNKKAKAENREVTPEEMAACESAGIAAVEEREEREVQRNEDEIIDRQITLQHAYFAACCNVVRGVSDLSPGLAKEAAATLQTPAVDFETWKKRLGY